jgi:hypothetical protein
MAESFFGGGGCVVWAVWEGGVSGRGSAPSVFDIWVKPEVDPPMGVRAAARVSFTVQTTVFPSFALRAGRVSGRASSSYCAFSTTNGSNFHEWGAASPEILLVGFIRVYSGYSWFKNIRAGWAEGVVWISMRWRRR